MSKEYKSSLFYSDLVKEKVEYLLPSYPALEHLSATFHEIGNSIDHHLEEWAERGVVNVISNINVSEISDHNARFLLTVTLSGSAPWSEERITAYKADVQAKKKAEENEHEEFLVFEDQNIKQLESLISQYPDLAAKMIADLIVKKE